MVLPRSLLLPRIATRTFSAVARAPPAAAAPRHTLVAGAATALRARQLSRAQWMGSSGQQIRMLTGEREKVKVLLVLYDGESALY
jgi:hypothetical protein